MGPGHLQRTGHGHLPRGRPSNRDHDLRLAPYYRSGSSDLSAASATWAILGAAGYVTLCLLSIGSIALALGLLLPRSVEALGITVAFLIGSAVLDNVSAVHDIIVILPVHYWVRWTQLFGGDGGQLLPGLAAQVADAADRSLEPLRW